MKIIRWRDVFALVRDEGTLPGELGGPRRRLWRASVQRPIEATGYRRGFEVGELVHLLDCPEEIARDDIIRACLGDDAWWMGTDMVVVPFFSGVSLPELLAQSSAEGGEIPFAAAMHVAVKVSRSFLRMLGKSPRSAGGVVDRIRIGFDGRVQLWFVCSCLLSPDEVGEHRPHVLTEPAGQPYVDLDEDDVIYDPDDVIFGVDPVYRRIALPEEASSPEEALSLRPDERSEVFVVGALLWQLLTGTHPCARDDEEASLLALRRAELSPMERELPQSFILNVLMQALHREPTLRPSLNDFVQALLPYHDEDEGREALAALTQGLFPATYEQELAFIDEAGLPLEPEDEVPDLAYRHVVRLRERMVRVQQRLVTVSDLVRWSRDTGRTLPLNIEDLEEDAPATNVSFVVADEYARWLGGRLPTDEEFTLYAEAGGFGWFSAARIGDLCRVWEWTSTPSRTGRIVRGGPWRDRDAYGRIDNRSWEDEPAPDVGFRVVFDE